jgi:predicted MFS family arabinose efflux permease
VCDVQVADAPCSVCPAESEAVVPGLSCLGAGALVSAPVLRVLLNRGQLRNLLAVSLIATAIAYFLLFTSSSLARALPAAIAIGMFGTISEVVPQTAIQRVIPNAVLGRVSAAFVTGKAAATLVGAVVGPFLAQEVHLPGIAAIASLFTLSAAVLTFLTMPRKSAIISAEASTRPEMPPSP